MSTFDQTFFSIEATLLGVLPAARRLAALLDLTHVTTARPPFALKTDGGIDNVKLSVKALALAGALIWGLGVGLAALAHLAFPRYGAAFLALVSSIYPGFYGGSSFRDALTGTAYGLADGGVGGAALAWIYNWLASRTNALPRVH